MTDPHDETSMPLFSGDDALPLDEWEPATPPADFAERVLARVRAEDGVVESKNSGRARPWKAATSLLGGLAVAAAVVVYHRASPSHGEAIANERIEVPLGSRALAVLEPGASVRWDGDDVVQSQGDVFYRVEPGKKFTVHTPAGDVAVKGTCFTVKVRPIGSGDGEMVRRDMKAGAAGAALSALAFVAVYEGKVAVSHASSSVDLRAGENAQTGPDGVKRLGADGSEAFEKSVTAAEQEDPADKANRNLVRQVSDYRSRLEAVLAQKSDIEDKLKKSEAQLAASQDGGPAVARNDFDLSADDWKELAKDGTIKFDMPCFRKEPWMPSAEQLNALGLGPDDGQAIQNVYARSNARAWADVKPICAKAVGSAELAEKIGMNTCVHLILDIESARDPAAAAAAQKQVAEIRAGLQPMPGPNEPVNPVEKVFLTMTGEGQNFEKDLAQTFGAEEAHRLRFADGMCRGTSIFGSNGKK